MVIAMDWPGLCCVQVEILVIKKMQIAEKPAVLFIKVDGLAQFGICQTPSRWRY